MPDAYKVNLQAAVDHHGHTVDYDHYNASINCCVKPFSRHDTEIIEHIRWENWNELVAMEIHVSRLRPNYDTAGIFYALWMIALRYLEQWIVH